MCYWVWRETIDSFHILLSPVYCLFKTCGRQHEQFEGPYLIRYPVTMLKIDTDPGSRQCLLQAAIFLLSIWNPWRHDGVALWRQTNKQSYVLYMWNIKWVYWTTGQLGDNAKSVKYFKLKWHVNVNNKCIIMMYSLF